jgi:hypothetical protein
MKTPLFPDKGPARMLRNLTLAAGALMLFEQSIEIFI